jgi:hypothetical protein
MDCGSWAAQLGISGNNWRTDLSSLAWGAAIPVKVVYAMAMTVACRFTTYSWSAGVCRTWVSDQIRLSRVHYTVWWGWSNLHCRSGLLLLLYTRLAKSRANKKLYSIRYYAILHKKRAEPTPYSQECEWIKKTLTLMTFQVEYRTQLSRNIFSPHMPFFYPAFDVNVLTVALLKESWFYTHSGFQTILGASGIPIYV